MYSNFQELKRNRPATEDDYSMELKKPSKKVLTREMYYGLETDFFGNLAKKTEMRIRNTFYNFDKDRAIDQYSKNIEAARSVEAVYAREKSILREAHAMRERRRMLPERGL